MAKQSRRSVQSRTGTGLSGLCRAWLGSMLSAGKPKTHNEYEQHMQEAFEAVTELQTIWRAWAYGGADSVECMRRVSQAEFHIDSDIWENPRRLPSALRMTRLYSGTLPYITAMVDAIEICNKQKVALEDRGKLLATKLAPSLFGQSPSIPRVGSTVPDNLARDGDYNFRWTNLPQHNMDKWE